MQTYHRNVARRHFPTLLLQLRGVRPFFSEKYDITKHLKYQYLSDFDKKNAFDIEKFLSTKLKLKADDVYEVFDMSEATEKVGNKVNLHNPNEIKYLLILKK